MNRKSDSPLERYFSALEAIAASVDGRSVSEIAESCDLPIATAHRLLQNLQHADLVASSGSKRRDYRLGKRLLRLLHAGSDTAWLTISAQPILDRLANEIADTCYLARLVGHEVVSVAWATPSDGLRGYVVPGHTLAPHVAASAKAILAFQPQALVDKALSGPLPQLTAKTKTKRKDINEDYRAVRENGYATCWDEMEVGLGAIAVPIHLPDIGVIYSLGIAGLIDRLTRRPVMETVALLRAALEPMTRALRNREPTDAPEARSRTKEQLTMRPADSPATGRNRLAQDPETGEAPRLLRLQQPSRNPRACPPGTEFLDDAETGRPKSPPRRVNAHREKNAWPKSPQKRPV